MLANVNEIVVFEVGERAEVIAHQYGHYFTLAQFSLAVTVLLIFKKKVFCTFGRKILAKLIHNTENLYNFVSGNHR